MGKPTTEELDMLQFGKVLHERPHRRALLVPGKCSYCDANRNDEMMPSHDPSPRCESGGRPHCTCGTCF